MRNTRAGQSRASFGGTAIAGQTRRRKVRLPVRSFATAFVLLCTVSASAQVGTEPLAWQTEHRDLADKLSTALLDGQEAAAAIQSIKAWRDGDRKPAFRNGCSAALALTTVGILKTVIHEDRPNGIDNKSFPSGHSAATAALTGWNFTFGVPISVATGLLRVNANWHHLYKDVFPGWGIGAVSQFACSKLIR